MNSPQKDISPDERRFMALAVIGRGLFGTKDATEWLSYLKDLGKHCAEAPRPA